MKTLQPKPHHVFLQAKRVQEIEGCPEKRKCQVLHPKLLRRKSGKDQPPKRYRAQNAAVLSTFNVESHPSSLLDNLAYEITLPISPFSPASFKIEALADSGKPQF